MSDTSSNNEGLPTPSVSFAEDKQGKVAVSDEELLRIRKDKAIAWLKSNYAYVSYFFLAIVIWIAVKIRTRNLAGLRDVTTGTWTLGPDLDPFLFLRWAKYIVEYGTLYAIDTMRYVPLGFETRGELLLLPYLMAWFHSLASIFGAESVTHSAVLFPVFMFALTVVAFFLLTRLIFVESLGEKSANVIALIASFFLSVLPPLLPRTIAGIPEKESAAFFFMFMAFYLFLKGWKSDDIKKGYLYSGLAGLVTAGMALVWGGNIYIFVTLAIALFGFFVTNPSASKDKLGISLTWFITSSIVMSLFSTRYALFNLLGSTVHQLTFIGILFMIIHLALFGTSINKRIRTHAKLSKIPPVFVSILASLLLGLVVFVVLFGPTALFDAVTNIVRPLINPISDRLGITVAENRQPYFNEWAGSFGPFVNGFPILFWLFFVGSVYLFNHMIKKFKKKDRIVLTLAYTLFLICLVFSRYSQTGVLNGENALSFLMYGAGFAILVGTFGYYVYKYNKEEKHELLKSIDFGFLLLFSLFFFSIVSARGAVRTIMVLVPAASIIVSYFVVNVTKESLQREKKDNLRLFGFVISGLLIVALVFSGYQFYMASNAQAQGFVPSSYTNQWQEAMGWVRENVREDAVFGHWWDYGYWVQSMGERATVLDGGNAKAYWNHFMGRYALTGPSNEEALDFLYAHNTTHFLIDSSDIGKYTAFSSIGSDENYDRRSWIPAFERDNSQVLETKNGNVYLYAGGFSLDEDIVYESNGTRVFLPGLNDNDMSAPISIAGLGGIRVEISAAGELLQPSGFFVYQGNQYLIPLRYGYYNGTLIDFESGLDAGVFFMPRLTQSAQGISLEENGALLFLSKRTVHSQLARLYLYNEDNPNFELVHAEDDFVIKNLNSQGANIGEFVYFQGLRGPIKIWEIEYPEDIKLNQTFLETEYPRNLLYDQ